MLAERFRQVSRLEDEHFNEETDVYFNEVVRYSGTSCDVQLGDFAGWPLDEMAAKLLQKYRWKDGLQCRKRTRLRFRKKSAKKFNSLFFP